MKWKCLVAESRVNLWGEAQRPDEQINQVINRTVTTLVTLKPFQVDSFQVVNNLFVEFNHLISKIHLNFSKNQIKLIKIFEKIN